MLSAVVVTILKLCNGLIEIYTLVVLASVLLTWVEPDPYNQIVRFIRQITEPALRPFRRLAMPLTRKWGIDISPIFLFLALSVMQTVIRQIIWRLGHY